MTEVFSTLKSFARFCALTCVLSGGGLLLDQLSPGLILSQAVAQDDKPKKERETRRTPAPVSYTHLTLPTNREV